VTKRNGASLALRDTPRRSLATVLMNTFPPGSKRRQPPPDLRKLFKNQPFRLLK
jgi:hypothetical protein